MQPDEDFLESPAPRTSGWLPSGRYYISKTGMPHRSGEVGDYGRQDGSHITAREMADLQRNGELEQMIRRIQRARNGTAMQNYDEEVEMPAPYDPDMDR